MKKLSSYLIIIVLAGLILISFWVYQNYFRRETTELLQFKVARGNLQELIKVRG